MPPTFSIDANSRSNGLDAGDYKVQFLKPTGFYSSTAANVGLDTADSDIAKSTGASGTTATMSS